MRLLLSNLRQRIVELRRINLSRTQVWRKIRMEESDRG